MRSILPLVPWERVEVRAPRALRYNASERAGARPAARAAPAPGHAATHGGRAEPMAVETRAETILQQLAAQGYRHTSTRVAIAEAIAARTTSFTARELVDELAPRGVGRATVFRVLDLLVQTGLLERLHGDVQC